MGETMEWQPIESAPKDGTRLLLRFPDGGGYTVCGRWDDDRYVSKPSPYWNTDLGRLRGKRVEKTSPPTHWMPLPSPPTEGDPRG